MNCPSSQSMEVFLRGGSSEPEHALLEQHLDLCSQCQIVLAQIAAVANECTPQHEGDTEHSREWSPEIAGRLAANLDHATADKARRQSETMRVPFVIGDYELLEVIGRGGMGTVYRARQFGLNRFVAVKVIVKQFLKPSVVDRFYVEAQSAGKLDHPGIVPVYDVAQHEHNVFYAMALVDGGSLADAIQGGPLSVRRAAQLVESIAEAVQYAHEHGVIHRDLKPSNILLETDDRPKVADFGLARQLDSGSDLTASGEVLGTPGYMPPEQADGHAVTTASDVYGIGAILFSVLTGRAPFEGDEPVALLYRVVNEDVPSLRNLNFQVPADLDTIAQKCLSKRPCDRYESAAEVARELGRFLRSEPILARPVGLTGRMIRWCRRRPAQAILAAVAVMALTGGTLFSSYFGILASRRAENLTDANGRLKALNSEALRSAEKARVQAERAAAQANTTFRLLESTLYELQPILTIDPAQQNRRKQLLTSVLTALDEIDDDLIPAVRLRRCRANALMGLAEVASQMGDDQGRTGLTASRPLYLQAIEQLQSLAREEPDDRTVLKDLVSASMEVGDMLAEAGEWRPARTYIVGALPAAERLAVEAPDDPAMQGQLVELQVLCAECFTHTGNADKAPKLFEAARERCQQVLQQFPDHAYVRGELVHTLLELGDWHILQKDLTAAEDCFTTMREEVKKIIARQPGDSNAILDLSTTWERLGDISAYRTDQSESLQRYEKSLEIAETAGRMAPDNDHLQWEVSFSHQKLADSYLRSGRTADARQTAMKCVRIRSRLAKADLQNSHLHGKLFHALNSLTTACEREGDFQEAIRWHEQRILFAEQFHSADQSNRFAGQIKQARAGLMRCQEAIAAAGLTS